MTRDLFLFVDAERLPCRWLIVDGLVVERQGRKLLEGETVMRGPDSKRGEREPRTITQSCSYLLGLSGTSCVQITKDCLEVVN